MNIIKNLEGKLDDNIDRLMMKIIRDKIPAKYYRIDMQYNQKG